MTQVELSGDTLFVDVEYPRVATPRFVRVDLVDVRAADGIRISYDFERDGWRIEQASVFEWDADDQERDPDWQEVAFVKAWARAKSPQVPPTDADTEEEPGKEKDSV